MGKTKTGGSAILFLYMPDRVTQLETVLEVPTRKPRELKSQLQEQKTARSRVDGRIFTLVDREIQ